MSLRLTVLGGSAAWPNPGQGCSSYLLESGTTKLLIDCGPDTLLELREHSMLSEIDAIVVSHCHSDHILDLVTYRYALVYSRDRPENRIPLWAPPGGIEILDALGSALGSQGEAEADFWREAFDLREYDPVRTLTIDDFQLDFSPTQHFTKCFAIRVETSSGKKLVYGSDTGAINPLISFSLDVDLLVAEATADTHDGIAPELRGHLIPEDAGEWAEQANASRLLITHLWCERDSAEVVARAATHYDGPIDVATRGLTIYV